VKLHFDFFDMLSVKKNAKKQAIIEL